jgi:hypothetical protein
VIADTVAVNDGLVLMCTMLSLRAIIPMDVVQIRCKCDRSSTQ